MREKNIILKTNIITLTFWVLSFLLVQCRVNRDTKLENSNVPKTEVTKADTTSENRDSTELLSNKKDEQTDAAVPQGVPHEGFVYVKNIIPDLIEDLRYFTDNNFMGEKADGYEANYAILSKEAATALSKAADELREKGYVVKIYDAYRPQKAVDHFVRWSKTSDQRNKNDYYPDLAKTSLFPTYIARKSGHSKGSTVDMTICYKDTKEEVDMGSHFDYFGPPSHPSFIGKYPGGEVTQQHKQNRMMLREVMVRHGFKPYDNEWWHFTLRNEPYPTTYFIFPVK